MISTKQWNKTLTNISIFNIIYIIYIFLSKEFNNKKKHLIFILTFIYTIVCAIRAIYPRIDGKCICLKDNFISLPIVGRTLATIAEISVGFIVNIFTNDLLKMININNKFNYLINFNNLSTILPIISQLFCWIGICTKKYYYNAIEETLWGLFGVSKVIIFYYIFKNINNDYIKNISFFGFISSLLYVIYMFIIDVPSYMTKYGIQKNNEKIFYNLKDGLFTLTKCKESSNIKYWKSGFLYK